MTGTADTEAFEFKQIYGLEVVVVPAQADGQDDRNDLMFLRCRKNTPPSLKTSWTALSGASLC